MILYTAQYRYNGEDRYDITVKSGNKIFAPTWNIVMDYKNNIITAEEYTKEYHNLMVKSYYNNLNEWNKLLNEEQITLVCFCKSGDFCHRLLLAEYLSKLDAEYLGERNLKEKRIII